MFRKLPIVIPVAILLGAASAAPAAAQTGSHHAAQSHRLSSYAGRLPDHARAYSAYAFAPSAAQSSVGCPPLEGYPDCHPNGGTPWTIYSSN